MQKKSQPNLCLNVLSRSVRLAVFAKPLRWFGVLSFASLLHLPAYAEDGLLNQLGNRVNPLVINSDTNNSDINNANISSSDINNSSNDIYSSDINNNDISNDIDSAYNDISASDLAAIDELNALELDQQLPEINAELRSEIIKTAEAAKQQAVEQQRAAYSTPNNVNDSDDFITHTDLVTESEVNVDLLQQQLAQDQIDINDDVTVTEDDRPGQIKAAETTEPVQNKKLFDRFMARFKTPIMKPQKTEFITVEVNGAPEALAQNLHDQLSSITVDSFSDFSLALPRMRTTATQAAQAVGYYNAQFDFKQIDSNSLQVDVVANDPVRLEDNAQIIFTGEGENLPAFKIIEVVPELVAGDVLNHQKYETIKKRINTAALDNGFFDAYWRMQDVKVLQPDNVAEIDLRYETGDRYRLADVEFRMTDPDKPLPIDLDLLNKMAPFKAGAPYTAWRLNVLSNNLVNSRYFNSSMVDAIRPDPLENKLEVPDDLKALSAEDDIAGDNDFSNSQSDVAGNTAVASNEAVDESQFAGAGTDNTESKDSLTLQRDQELADSQKQRENERAEIAQQARETKQIPVVVYLNADKLNTLETGIGYGTDTGARLRSQYRRSIVNKRGHQFDANLEISQVRQAIDARYGIPYKHPLNDVFNVVTGYEREVLDNRGLGLDLDTESAVIGVERVIRPRLGEWSHNISTRYRLDRVTKKGDIATADLPKPFNFDGADLEQESLLLGYEIEKIVMNDRINPTQGFYQRYSVEAGVEEVLNETDLAILKAGMGFIYSLGENDNHQFVGRGDWSTIITDDFDKVPYNLRFFAGGDHSIRGFDYKSLSTKENGYLIGGKNYAVGSMEYNYQFKPGWRVAMFGDAGNAFDAEYSNPIEYGAGVGIRWKSPVGPIRLDVAAGLSDEDMPIRLHFFIGPSL